MGQLNSISIILSNKPCHLKFMLNLNLFKGESKILIEVAMLPILKNIKSIFLVVFLVKACALMIDLANWSFSTEKKMQSISGFQQFLMSMNTADQLF